MAAKKQPPRKIAREDILNELLDVLSTVQIGYPWYGVPRTIRRAIRYVREQKDVDFCRNSR